MNDDSPLSTKNFRKVATTKRCGSKKTPKTSNSLRVNIRAQQLYKSEKTDDIEAPRSTLFKSDPSTYRKRRRQQRKNKHRLKTSEQFQWHIDYDEMEAGFKMEEELNIEQEQNKLLRKQGEALYVKIASLKQTFPNHPSNWNNLMYCTKEQQDDYEIELMDSIHLLKNQIYDAKNKLSILRTKYHHLSIAKEAKQIWSLDE